MLTGEPPYTGSSAQVILGKIIAGEFPLVRFDSIVNIHHKFFSGQ